MRWFRKDRRSGETVGAAVCLHRWGAVRSAAAGLPVALAICLLSILAGAPASAQQHFHGHPGFGPGSFAAPRGMGHFGQRPERPHPQGMQPRREHLPQWFHQHRSMSPQAQQRALRKEPGFKRLPPQEQRRLSNRLRQLDAMTPAQRQRTMQRVEAWERLTPQQRQQVRDAIQHVGQLPQPRQRMLHKAFRDLSRVPPAERQTIMNSPQFRSEFSPDERQTLQSLMRVQPYIPPHPPGGPPPAATGGP